MIKILAADDHPIVLEGIRRVIEETSDIVIADEAKTGTEVLEKVRKNEYDLILLDISMPERSGLDILKDLKRLKPYLPILILTIHPEKDLALRLLKDGASGYLTKEKATEELVNAIRKVSTGHKYVSSSLAEDLVLQATSAVATPSHQRLSSREYQVMCMIAQGEKMRNIAEELSLSIKTIESHRRRILEKMGMKGNVEIVRYAIRNCLIE